MLPNPLALIAEVTHRCPLHCVYCSNPLQMTAANLELTTQDWVRVFHEAAAMKLLHLHLTGGEPLARADIRELIAEAHTVGLYTNLITSGIGLTEARLRSEEHTSELQSQSNLVCRLLLEKKKTKRHNHVYEKLLDISQYI